jgi:hypothetical protein
MTIILKRIPEQTKKRDIADFFEPALKGKFFQKSGLIESIKILVLQDSRTKELEYHGLVSFDSDEVANRITKKFNRNFFLGKYIAISEYHRRSWENDPRISSYGWDGGGESRRKKDRRRENLKERKRTSFKYINY